MNLSQITQLQNLRKHLNLFRQDHPKFPAFLDAVNKNALEKGTIMEINVTTPDGKNYVTNIRLNENDIVFLKELQKLNQMKS